MVMSAPSQMVIGEANDRTTKGVVSVSGTACDEGGAGGAGWVSRRLGLVVFLLNHEREISGATAASVGDGKQR